jgi:hypothetical protein
MKARKESEYWKSSKIPKWKSGVEDKTRLNASFSVVVLLASSWLPSTSFLLLLLLSYSSGRTATRWTKNILCVGPFLSIWLLFLRTGLFSTALLVSHALSQDMNITRNGTGSQIKFRRVSQSVSLLLSMHALAFLENVWGENRDARKSRDTGKWNDTSFEAKRGVKCIENRGPWRKASNLISLELKRLVNWVKQWNAINAVLKPKGTGDKKGWLSAQKTLIEVDSNTSRIKEWLLWEVTLREIWQTVMTSNWKSYHDLPYYEHYEVKIVWYISSRFSFLENWLLNIHSPSSIMKNSDNEKTLFW